ncbi:MAG TPA: RidA family protein [Alphaproteobacteria bacterium]|jgi:enamine deaminase RidA (YjgF/YER057c/UK114 family)
MAGKIDARLKELGITLPAPAKPAGNYVGYVVTGNLVFLSGQLPFEDGKVKVTGKVGKDVTIEQAQAAARLVALNTLANLREACGDDLDRVRRCVKVGGFVNATPDFTQPPQVINGFSDLLAEVFGDIGKHARFAIGTNSLPLGAVVEVDAVFEIA